MEKEREEQLEKIKTMMQYIDKFFSYYTLNSHKISAEERDIINDLSAEYGAMYLSMNRIEMGHRRLLVVGSRSIKNIDLSKFIPKDVDIIITGGANGIDKLAEEFADKNKLSKIIVRPNYKFFKKGAPLMRNESMVNLSRYVLAIWDGKSSGTKYTIDYARKKGKQVIVINPNEEQGL